MINLKVTEERIQGVKVGILRKIETSTTAQFAFLARFMTDEDGEYLDEEDAYEILDEIPLGDIAEIMTDLRAAMEEAAVPNGSGGRFGGASSRKRRSRSPGG